MRLYAGERGFTFSQAGEYDVEVTCAGIVGAATTHVRVIAPIQPIDVEQSRALLANPDVAYFFLIDGGDHPTAAKNLLISVSNTNSIFQPYARVVLGLSLARDFAFVSRGVVRRADPEAASGYLAQPADAALSAYYGLLRKVELERLATQAGNAALAQQLRSQIDAQLRATDAPAIVRQGLQQAFSR